MSMKYSRDQWTRRVTGSLVQVKSVQFTCCEQTLTDLLWPRPIVGMHKCNTTSSLLMIIPPRHVASRGPSATTVCVLVNAKHFRTVIANVNTQSSYHFPVLSTVPPLWQKIKDYQNMLIGKLHSWVDGIVAGQYMRGSCTERHWLWHCKMKPNNQGRPPTKPFKGVHILFLTNHWCPQDYDLVVAIIVFS